MDFEIKIIQFLQAGRTPFFDLFFQIISAIGSVLAVVALSVLFLIFKRKLCFWYLFSYGFVLLAVKILKDTIKRVRPFNVTDTILNLGDATNEFSFPSGHAACATAIAIFLAYFLFQYFKSKPARIATVICVCVYVGIVCLSRMYLGKHYLTDLIAGVAVSAVICVAGILFMRWVQKRKEMKKNEN